MRFANIDSPATQQKKATIGRRFVFLHCLMRLSLWSFYDLPLRRAEQLDSTRGSRRGLCACRHVKRSSFAGAGAKTRSTDINTGAHDSHSAPSYARREPSLSRSEARCVRLARSSCAVAPSRQAAQGHPVNTGRDSRGGLLWVTFLGRARKVTSRRAAPGLVGWNQRSETFSLCLVQ